MSEDKAIHTLYEMLKTGDFMCVVPYGDKGRYATYYAEDRLYLVLDLWYHGLFLVEAKSPRDAIDQVNCDRLAYIPKEEGADDERANRNGAEDWFLTQMSKMFERSE